MQTKDDSGFQEVMLEFKNEMIEIMNLRMAEQDGINAEQTKTINSLTEGILGP